MSRIDTFIVFLRPGEAQYLQILGTYEVRAAAVAALRQHPDALCVVQGDRLIATKRGGKIIFIGVQEDEACAS